MPCGVFITLVPKIRLSHIFSVVKHVYLKYVVMLEGQFRVVVKIVDS